LQDLLEERAQRLGTAGEAARGYCLTELVTGDVIPLRQAVPEQRRQLSQPQLSFACPFDEREQRTKFILRRDERREGRAEHTFAPADDERRFAAQSIRSHAGTTAPELSSCSV